MLRRALMRSTCPPALRSSMTSTAVTAPCAQNATSSRSRYRLGGARRLGLGDGYPQFLEDVDTIGFVTFQMVTYPRWLCPDWCKSRALSRRGSIGSASAGKEARFQNAGGRCIFCLMDREEPSKQLAVSSLRSATAHSLWIDCIGGGGRRSRGPSSRAPLERLRLKLVDKLPAKAAVADASHPRRRLLACGGEAVSSISSKLVVRNLPADRLWARRFRATSKPSSASWSRVATDTPVSNARPNGPIF